MNQAVHPARRTVEVWCEIPNPGYRLRAGVFGGVAVITRVEHRPLSVPQAAVQFQEGTPRGIALVVDSRGLAHQREVWPVIGQMATSRYCAAWRPESW